MHWLMTGCFTQHSEQSENICWWSLQGTEAYEFMIFRRKNQVWSTKTHKSSENVANAQKRTDTSENTRDRTDKKRMGQVSNENDVSTHSGGFLSESTFTHDFFAFFRKYFQLHKSFFLCREKHIFYKWAELYSFSERRNCWMGNRFTYIRHTAHLLKVDETFGMNGQRQKVEASAPFLGHEVQGWFDSWSECLGQGTGTQQVLIWANTTENLPKSCPIWSQCLLRCVWQLHTSAGLMSVWSN